MKRASGPALAAVLALLASPGAAQQTDDRTRLDDFAIPTAAATLKIEQVSPDTPSVEPTEQPDVRAVVNVPRGDRPALRPEQISRTGGSSEPTQLSDGSNPTGPIPTAGSTAADSRPQGVTRLAGSDRCDPQLAERERAQCLRILELRAQEFDAPAPPQLSAEESLLAAQRTDEERSMGGSSEGRLRLASVPDPDADLGSNQELASIYLDRTQPGPERPPEGELRDEAASLADILVTLVQGGAPPPPQ